MQLYHQYKSECEEAGVKIMCKTDFYNEFKKRNLALYTPKKDCCDLCEGFKYGHISQEDYDNHQSRKNDARNAKELAKVFAKNNSNDEWMFKLLNCHHL